MKNLTPQMNRRDFLKGGGALVVSAVVPAGLSTKPIYAADNMADGQATLNAFVRIAEDNTITVLIKHIEFGQGPFTGLATLVAEEMDADWSQMRAEHAPADAKLYANAAFGIQGTGGSTAIASSFIPMRQAGATARAMLMQAAANRWGVKSESLRVEKGVISHGSGKSATFGDLAAEAAQLPAPTGEPELKHPKDFKLIGTHLKRIDLSGKVNGQATYTIDIKKDDMLYAVVAHPPTFGAKLKSFDDKAARAIPGVKAIKAIDFGVAVYATNTHAAIKGRQNLKIDWDETGAEKRSTKTLAAELQKAVQAPGMSAMQRGDFSAAQAEAAEVLEVDYHFPFLAHATMEPLDAVVQFKDGQVNAWMGSQLQTIDQSVMAANFGVTPDKVAIHTQLAGGSFGRRATPDSALAAEAAQVVKAIGTDQPVKLLWTREDDIQGGRYRPMVAHKLRGAIGEDGQILGWQQTVATQSIMAGSAFEGMIQNGIDPTSVEGAADLPYAIPSLDVSLHNVNSGVPILWWRSVGHTHTAYAVETFLDQLLEKAGKDPLEGRLELLKEHPRESAVLREVANLAAKDPEVKGRARGVAVHKSFNSYVAEMAEVEKGSDGMPRVTRVWCAVDCGLVLNPDNVETQVQSAIGYGLSAVLFNGITLADGGRVEQSNFHNYRTLRIDEMPEVKVSIIKSAELPTGIGEPGTPPIGPAVANAWRRLTGQLVTDLPFSKSV